MLPINGQRAVVALIRRQNYTMQSNELIRCVSNNRNDDPRFGAGDLEGRSARVSLHHPISDFANAWAKGNCATRRSGGGKKMQVQTCRCAKVINFVINKERQVMKRGCSRRNSGGCRKAGTPLPNLVSNFADPAEHSKVTFSRVIQRIKICQSISFTFTHVRQQSNVEYLKCTARVRAV